MFHHGLVKEYSVVCLLIKKRVFSSSSIFQKYRSKLIRKFPEMSQAKPTLSSRKKFALNTTPCNIRVTVIGCGTHGNPKTLSLEASDKLYLFNCGDGTQKLMGDAKSVSSSKIDHIFVTQLSWANVGGIYGKSLGKKESIINCGTTVTIHGAKEMADIIKHSVMFAEDRLFTDSFVYKDISDGTFEDVGLSVDYVPLSSSKCAVEEDKESKFIVRKCHLRRNNKDSSFGFVCLTKNSEPGNFIGNVTPDSSAELCRLKTGDKIIELNGVNVEELAFTDVIERIKCSDCDIEVLVVDQDCDTFCEENGIVISSLMEDTEEVSVQHIYDNSIDQPSSELWTETRPVNGYIVKFKEDKQRVKKEVLDQHGIKPGPFCKEILNGKTVEVNGMTFTPEMLLEEREIIRPVLIVDCPSEFYLDSLLAADQFSMLIDNPNTVPQLIVHFSPCSVLDNPRYQLFMQRFNSEDTHHIMLNEKSPPVAPVRLLSRHLVMNKIHPEIFPPLHYDQTVKEQEGHIIQGVNNLQYIVKPRSQAGISWAHTPNLNAETMLAEHFEELKFAKEANQVLGQVQSKCRKLENSSQETREYPVITFLGTGSAVPSLYRSQTCILVETRKDEFVILDCGEASLMQLYLKFGETKAEEILSNLKAVFVSHLHFDHHGGLTSLALRRRELLQKQKRFDKLMLIAPAKMKKWLMLLSRHIYNTDRLFETVPMMYVKPHKEHKFDLKTHSRIKDVLNVEKTPSGVLQQTYESILVKEATHNILKYSQSCLKRPLLGKACMALKPGGSLIQELTAVPVDHSIGSFGAYIKHVDGWTLMYSGDTRPCKSLVLQGYDDTDFLIHEATFSSSETRLAYDKKHSTIDQAVSIGKQMKAKHTILTHFSQRHYSHPVFEDLEEGVAFAYDFMQLKPKHIPLVSHLKPALALMFDDGKVPANFTYAGDLVLKIQQENQTVKRNNTDSLEGAPDAKEPKLDVETV